MSDNVVTLPSGVPAALLPPPTEPATPAATVSADPKTGTATPQAATRLLVEPDGAMGYVYRLVDVVTGRLLAEVPRERADELKSSPDYAAGALVSTSV